MFFSGTRLIAPKIRNDPEFYTPTTAELGGVCYDYSEHCVVVFDNAESKLMWLHKDTEALMFAVDVPVPTAGDFLVDMCSIQDLIFMLFYKGNGHMSICHGALSQGKQDHSLLLTEYLLPYGATLPGGTSVWTATHDGSMRYLRYHPMFTSMFNIGQDLYICAGLSDDVTSFNPINLGQWMLHYDLSGLILNRYRADDSPSATNRPHILVEDKLNGRIIASTCHDGIINGLALSVDNAYTGVLKIMKPTGNLYSTSTQLFMTGPYDRGASMCAVGRVLYHTANHRLFRSNIYMFEIWTYTDGGLISNTIDMGTITAGTATTRKVYLKNVSPYYEYYALEISTRTPDIYLSRTNDPGTFSESIKISEDVKVGDTVEFYVKVLAQDLPEERMPVQFYEDLIITSAMNWGDA